MASFHHANRFTGFAGLRSRMTWRILSGWYPRPSHLPIVFSANADARSSPVSFKTSTVRFSTTSALAVIIFILLLKLSLAIEPTFAGSLAFWFNSFPAFGLPPFLPLILLISERRASATRPGNEIAPSLSFEINPRCKSKGKFAFNSVSVTADSFAMSISESTSLPMRKTETQFSAAQIASFRSKPASGNPQSFTAAMFKKHCDISKVFCVFIILLFTD